MTSKLSAADRARLIRYGFDPTGEKTINRHRRLIMKVSGPDKVGKTAFALRATPPVMYFNFDRRLEEFSIKALGVDPSDIIVNEIRIDRDEAQDLQKKKWKEVCEAYTWALEDADSIRSIVFDTESQLWELARLAEFGRLSQVKHLFTALNAKYSRMISEAEGFDKNLILLQRLKKQYVDDSWNGKMEVAGFGSLKYLSQINTEMRREIIVNEDTEQEEQKFTLKIVNNGLKAAMNGMEFSGMMCEFKWVASMLTDTSPTEWE